MPECMRYPDSGGLSAVGRVRREMVRLQAAQMFEQDVSPVQVARELRVSTKSVYQWRRCRRSGGEAALASRGPGGAVCRLSPAQLAKLRAALDGGSAAWGWSEDQRWTLGRVTMLIGRLFHVRYTLRGTSYLLHRIGFSPQVPVHRAVERGEAKIAAWRAVTWAKVRGSRRRPGRISASRTRPARACARRSPRTPAALAPMPFHKARAGFRSGVEAAASHGPTQAFAARQKRSRSVETLPVRMSRDAHDLRRDGRRARTARAARVGVRTGAAAQELLPVGLVR